MRFHFRFGKFPHTALQQLLFFGEIKIHATASGNKFALDEEFKF
jgi:hypothetical protein